MTPTILVIDSGIGGLSVTQHIRRVCSGVKITYIADTAHFPYGQKSETAITSRIHTLVEYGMSHAHPDLVVIACNTASTVALDTLRNTFHTPFVGVVPAVKPAALKSQSGKIGVLATEGTVNRPYTQNLISAFAQNHSVFLYGSSVLVQIAEEKLKGIEPDEAKIRADLQKLVGQHADMDTIVLACTHFPLLKNEFQRLFPHIKHWVDSGEAIARRVEFLLTGMGFPAEGREQNHHLIVTGTRQSTYKGGLLQPFLGSYMSEFITL